MSTTETQDDQTFTRRVEIVFDPAEMPEYKDSWSKRQGRVDHVRIRYEYQFDRKQWRGTATVVWRWNLKSGVLGEQSHTDPYARGSWVEGLIAEHMPTSTIEFKENN